MKRLGVSLVKILACAKTAASGVCLMSADDRTRRAKSGKIKIIDVHKFIEKLLGNHTDPDWIEHGYRARCIKLHCQ